jgi:hypothetical protein
MFPGRPLQPPRGYGRLGLAGHNWGGTILAFFVSEAAYNTIIIGNE